jgi:hypothetical protein
MATRRLVGEMSDWSELRIAQLLAALPPAPEAWVQAARELPKTRRELDDVVGRVEADAEFRRRVLDDIELALGSVEPERRAAAAAALRAHLARDA